LVRRAASSWRLSPSPPWWHRRHTKPSSCGSLEKFRWLGTGSPKQEKKEEMRHDSITCSVASRSIIPSLVVARRRLRTAANQDWARYRGVADESTGNGAVGRQSQTPFLQKSPCQRQKATFGQSGARSHAARSTQPVYTEKNQQGLKILVKIEVVKL
jgi:hypothetical protein